MKIIFAFRTRLSFLSKEKTLYTICYAVVNLLLALLRILTYGNSRVLPALFRFARDSGSLLAFLPSLSPLPTYFFNKSLVGSNGLGPSTSRLSGVCSNQLSYEPMCGGGNRIRTDDPLLAGQVLYQLSYTPAPSVISAASSKNNASLALGLLPAKESTRLLKTNKKEISPKTSFRFDSVTFFLP